MKWSVGVNRDEWPGSLTRVRHSRVGAEDGSYNGILNMRRTASEYLFGQFAQRLGFASRPMSLTVNGRPSMTRVL
jgi:hypothetical protein